MNQRANERGATAVIILIILLVLCLGALGAGYYYYQEEKGKVLSLSEQVDNLKVEKRIVETKLTESTKQAEALTGEIKKSSEKIQDISAQLGQSKASEKTYLSKISSLNTQLLEQAELKDGLQEQYTKVQQELSDLEALNQDLKANAQILQTELAKAKAMAGKQEVALGKIVVEGEELAQDTKAKTTTTAQGVEVEQPEAETDAEAAIKSTPKSASLSKPTGKILEAKVLVANKDYDFMVINVGSRDGIAVGDVFSIYRSGVHVGQIKTEKVQATMAACGFVSGDVKNAVKEGDKIALNSVNFKKKAKIAKASRQISTESLLEGKVLVVNKDYEFAVINLGSRNGINTGESFSVYRNDDYIGDILVDKVQDAMSACAFKTQEIKTKISEGDKVVRK